MRALAGVTLGLAAASLMAGSLTAALAQVESAPSFDVTRIAGLKPTGENYQIRNPVQSDGLLRAYRLNTTYGPLPVRGDGMLRMRLTELAALANLERMSSSEAFGKALANAGLRPLKYTEKFITNPTKTIGDTFAGVGALFERAQSSIANTGKAPDDPLSSLLGVTDERRKLAVRFGVDPYTDYPPLDAKLSRLSEAATAGGLTVTGAMMVIPGGAGIVISNLGTASSLEGIKVETLARDYTASQIFDLNRKRMVAMGTDPRIVEALLANRSYTPIDMAAMVGALDGMPEVRDRTLYLRRAAQIDDRTVAYLMREHAELLASQHKRGMRFERFVSLGGYMFNVVRGGHIVGVVPIDVLAWTAATAPVWRESAAEARRVSPGGRVELHITGTATPLAKQELKKLGWQLVERVRL